MCNIPCLECRGTASTCISCISGFTRIGWKCQKNEYVGFTITLQANF